MFIAGVTQDLIHLIQEYIIELTEDASLKDIDLLYFEIWRLVAKEDVSILIKHLCNNALLTCFVIIIVRMVSKIFQRKYLDAVKEVYAMDKFAIHKRVLHAELNAGTVFVTIKQMVS